MLILTIACLIMLGMIIESFFPIKNVANNKKIWRKIFTRKMRLQGLFLFYQK